MKRIIICVILVVCVWTKVNAQGCPIFEYTFLNQSNVDNFRRNFPNCKSLVEPLNIQGNSVTNLDSLIGLEQIHTLRITNAPNLTSLRGLDNVCVQTGDFVLDGTGVVNLAQYQPSWVDSTRSIVIQNNHSLRDVTGFVALK